MGDGPVFNMPGGEPPDDEVDGLDGPVIKDEPEPTMLSALLDELAAEPDLNPTVTLTVKARPGWAVRYRTRLPYEDVQAWLKAGKDKKILNGVNEARSMAITLAHACDRILHNGSEVEADGEPVTFGTPALWDLLRRPDHPISRAADAVRAFYGADGHVILAGVAVLDAAGYADEAVEVDDEDEQGRPDPTNR